MLLKDEELSLREIQHASLEILKRIDGICKQENLKYYLAYGSLIGAVRHQGFIPWDDDLDIAMPRPDYDALLAYFDSHEEEMRPLLALHNTASRKLPFLITRISDTRYKMIGENSYDAPELGVFIDIYPLDGVGSNEQDAISEKLYCYNLIKKYLKAANFKSYNMRAGFFKRLAKGVRSKLLGPAERYEKELLGRCSSEMWVSSSFVACKIWTVESIQRMVNSKEVFGEGVVVPFEDMLAPIPSGYDVVLRRQYGDYMKLPPENERVGHHFYKVVMRDDFQT